LNSQKIAYYKGVDPVTGKVSDQVFDVKRKQLKNIGDQLKIIMKNLVDSSAELQKLKKVNLNLESQYRHLLPQDSLQFKDAVTIADAHVKEKAVINDSEVVMKTLQLNFQKWFNEYSVCEHKIKARDAAKQKLERARDEVMKEQLQRDFDFQNKMTYQVMYELVDTRFNMLNPIITKWLQVQ
jgi:hypothetical protein